MLCDIFLFLTHSALAAEIPDINTAITNARNACSGISDKLAPMKTRAGIATASTGVATVAGGTALITGLMKESVDDDLAQYAHLFAPIMEEQHNGDTDLTEISDEDMEKAIEAALKTYDAENETQTTELYKKSQTLGNIRTGTLATAAVTDTVGTIISATNRTNQDLESHIADCVSAVKVLAQARIQARASENPDNYALDTAERIISECGKWSTVDTGTINNKSTAASIAGGLGAAMGIAGTATSAVANSTNVRYNSAQSGDRSNEQNLNTASNVLAGGTTVASGVATVFNATQISAIKQAADVATQCEGVLK